MDTGLGEEEQKSHHDNRYRRLILRTPRGDRAAAEQRRKEGWNKDEWEKPQKYPHQIKFY